MVETVVTEVLSKFGELAAREAKVLLHLGDDMMLLHDRLDWLRAVISDADQKRRAGTDDGLTRVLVCQTRDVAFMAEDALDQFFYQVELKNLPERFNILAKPSLWSNLFNRHRLSGQITRINSRLNQISENQKAYNIQHTPSVTSASSTTATLAWRDDFKDGAVGLEVDMKTLTEMAFQETNPDQVFISIFGESGAGKFTLADNIFSKLNGMFNVSARYSMPPDSNSEVLLKGVYNEVLRRLQLRKADFKLAADLLNDDIAGMLRSLLPNDDIPEETASSSAASTSKEKLDLLLVLGGISSITSLNCLKACFPADGHKVVVILDTESEEVARHADTMNRVGTRKAVAVQKDDTKKAIAPQDDTMQDVAEDTKAMALQQGDMKDDISDPVQEVMKDTKAVTLQPQEITEDAMNSVATSKTVAPQQADTSSPMQEVTEDTIYTKRILMLSHLDEARSIELFHTRVFGKENIRMEADLEEEKSRYSKIVYNITGGCPLAIVLLAGLLRFKEKHDQWEAVLQQLSNPGAGGVDGNEIQLIRLGVVLSKEKHVEWRLNQEANLSTRTGVDRVFCACFVDLPNELKSCLLYFAAFARHTYIYADRLVRMWIAEGFVKRPQQGRTMEEQGDDYLKELVSRCLVQIVETNAIHGIEKVRLHMRLHGFLLSEAREAGFVEVHDMHDTFVPQSVRRIAFKSFDCRYTIPRNKFPKLRSFICNVKEEEGGDLSSGKSSAPRKTRNTQWWTKCCTGDDQAQAATSTQNNRDKKAAEAPTTTSDDQARAPASTQNNRDKKAAETPTTTSDDQTQSAASTQNNRDKKTAETPTTTSDDQAHATASIQNNRDKKEAETPTTTSDDQAQVAASTQNNRGKKAAETPTTTSDDQAQATASTQNNRDKKAAETPTTTSDDPTLAQQEDAKKRKACNFQQWIKCCIGDDPALAQQTVVSAIHGGDAKKEDMHNINFLNASKFLRVISIVGLKLKNLPKEIGDLIHLRYLLVHSRHLEALPSDIARLLNLQTLDIRKTQVKMISPGFWKIKVLRHLLAEMLTLPETLVEELRELQTLHGVMPKLDKDWVKENCPLDKMTNLRSVELQGLEHAKHGSALENALRKMHLLRHLKLKGDTIPECVFKGQCLQSLQTIELDGTVSWPTSDSEEKDVRKLRPNLVQITLVKDTKPQPIGFKRVPLKSKPVYRLPHDLEGSRQSSGEE